MIRTWSIFFAFSVTHGISLILEQWDLKQNYSLLHSYTQCATPEMLMQAVIKNAEVNIKANSSPTCFIFITGRHYAAPLSAAVLNSLKCPFWSYSLYGCSPIPSFVMYVLFAVFVAFYRTNPFATVLLMNNLLCWKLW